MSLLPLMLIAIPAQGAAKVPNLNFKQIPTSTITGKRAVLKVKVFAYYGEGSSSSGGLGHAYLSFENLDYNERYIGYARMIITGGATIGTWGNQGSHKGLWYNLESYYSMDSSAYDGRVSLTTYLDEDEKAVLHRYIFNYEEKWTLTQNCSYFAMNTWNLISDDKISAGSICTPKNLANSIRTYDYYETNSSFPNVYVSPFYVENGLIYKFDNTSYANLETEFNNPYSYWEE